MRGRVLAVGGSDSSGGAGIQADIKTITALDAYAMTAITAITVQDTRGVHCVEALSPALVATQMACVLDDIGADAVKCGMLGAAATIEAPSPTSMAWTVTLPPDDAARSSSALAPSLT